MTMTDEKWSLINKWLDNEPDNADGYPTTMMAVLIVGINTEAVRWIDENLPKAWYRPMFAT